MQRSTRSKSDIKNAINKKELQLRAAHSLRCGGRPGSAVRSDELRELQNSSLRA